MISRGEVALIVATKGAALGLMDSQYFAPIIIVVVATTIITPILLKLIYKYQEKHPELIETNIITPLIDNHQDKDLLEHYVQTASRLHSETKEQNEKRNKDD